MLSGTFFADVEMFVKVGIVAFWVEFYLYELGSAVAVRQRWLGTLSDDMANRILVEKFEVFINIG
jgi:hypothetical protein